MQKQSKNMDNLRANISNVDEKLIAVLAERKGLSEKVAKEKFETGITIRDKKQEQKLLANLISKGREKGLDAHYVVSLFNSIIEDSILSQHMKFQEQANPEAAEEANRVSFLGKKGSYSHQALERYFQRRDGRVIESGCDSFKQVVEKVESEQVKFGILPLENSTSGSINEVYDLLQYTSLSIIGEITQPITHCLLSPFANTLLEEIATLYVHPQVATQCSQFIATLDGVNIKYCDSSSSAMKRAQADNSRTSAALGGEIGGTYYDLHPLDKNLANQKENHTRFIIVSAKAQKVAELVPAKTSLIFSCGQKPGSLVNVLSVLKDHEISLNKLQSRPIEGNPWEEMFYIDVDANIEHASMVEALEELAQHTRYMKVLGCYPNASIQPTEVGSSAMSNVLKEPSKAKVAKAKTTKKKGPKKSYHLTSREYQEQDTIIDFQNCKIGGDSFVTIAGPCAIESREQIFTCAKEVKEYGAEILRGGCFKPRTNPYSFQGLGYDGLDMMQDAGKKYKLPIVTEVLSVEDVIKVAKQADMLQIGARNMQNFRLLKEVGKVHRPVFLKRGLMASLDELLNAAEYILAQGNKQVILCERGIRTFETATRNTLDLSAVPILKQLTHLPIMIDPSHAVGRRDLVAPMAKAAKAVGAHGIMIEIHPEPEVALSDGPQALRFPMFEELMADLYK